MNRKILPVLFLLILLLQSQTQNKCSALQVLENLEYTAPLLYQ